MYIGEKERRELESVFNNRDPIPIVDKERLEKAVRDASIIMANIARSSRKREVSAYSKLIHYVVRGSY